MIRTFVYDLFLLHIFYRLRRIKDKCFFKIFLIFHSIFFLDSTGIMIKMISVFLL